MTFRLPVAVLMIPLALAACGKKQEETATPAAAHGPVAPVAPPAGQDWTEVVSATPDGGYRMGNPNAAVKLVEYASLTCPHCRDFTAEAGEPLRDKYIRTGQVSWEYRPFILNGLDVAAFLLARCQGPQPFFKLAEQAYADQVNWVTKFEQMPPAEQQRIQALDPSQQFKALAQAAGLDGFFRARGLASAKEDQCLSDTAAAEALVKIRDHATNDLDVQGTPTFFIDGKLRDSIHTWPELDTALGQAIG